jgi:hypothetical protein
MTDKKVRLQKIIDYSIYVVLIIFLLSISNSIFVNQIGYYGVLLLLLAKYWVTKENPFSKSGLEFPILWYMLAELISFILSPYKEEALQGLMKRYFLIPMIYTTIAVITDFNQAKRVFKIYIGGTLVTVLIYLYFSFNHYISNLYGITESGPSVFQYPITASEILSFTVIFLFAFLVNEKTSIKNKIFLFIGFAISLLALFSTYKRTGWIGAAFGILIILVLKKQWKIIVPAALLVAGFYITQKNISEVNVYSLVNNEIVLSKSFITEGKASDVFPFNDQLMVSDYNKGMVIYKDYKPVGTIELPSAVTSFNHWKDNFYLANLIDTRFVLLEYDENKFVPKSEFVSPGMTYSYAIANSNLYVADKDSGLTIFTNPLNSEDKFYYSQFTGITNVFADSNYISLAGPEIGYTIYSLKDGFLPDKVLFKDSSKLDFFYYSSNFIFLSDKEGLSVFNFNSQKILLKNNFLSIKNIKKIVERNGKYFVASLDKIIYVLEKNVNDDFEIINTLELEYFPQGLNVFNNKLYLSHVDNKKSRFLSVIDPYHPANAGRLALWSAGFKMFLDYPIFGLGDIDLAKYFKIYKQPYQKEIQGHLHNNFIHILATLGLFGLLAVCLLFYKIIYIELKIYYSVKNERFISSYALGALAAFCGFIISGLTELNFWDHEITTLIWFTFGLNVAMFKSVKPDLKIN